MVPHACEKGSSLKISHCSNWQWGVSETVKQARVKPHTICCKWKKKPCGTDVRPALVLL